MGRREQPLDAAEGPVARFADELRKLRREAGGLTYRAMAAKAHYSAATLAQAAAGNRLPSLAVTSAYVRACGGDSAWWERRWHEAAREAAEAARTDDEDVEPPYLGLARFGVGDGGRFFGRDQLVRELTELVRRAHVSVVTGPSGCGKSSLLRAGLIAGLQQAEPPRKRPTAVRVLTPGPHPDRTHADVLDPLATPSGTLIVVDQLEEVFTLCADRTERARFLDRLWTAAQPRHGLRLVLAVRGDFYSHLAQHPSLARAVQGATLLVTPMGQKELREAIVRPAALGGCVVERSLTARIIDDVSDEPGGLALMSHALLETWRRRSGRVLVESAYDAAGGVHGAIARTAEDLYASLSPGQAETARRILLRLVSPGEGSQDTRCPADRGEVTTLGPGPVNDAGAVLERLARARLVTVGEDTVDLAHEAVLTAWPRLRTWIDEDRDRLRVQRHLTEAAGVWQALGRDPGSLYRGVRLSMAEQHCAAPDGPDDLTPLEREFLTSGLAARRRSRRRRRVRTAALSLLLALGLIASLIARQQNQAGERRRVEAEARRVVGVAEGLRTSDPGTAMRLSLAAWRVADLPETRAALLSALAQPEREAFTDPDTDADTMRYLSPDGRSLVSVGRQKITRWDVETRRRTASLPGLGKRLRSVGVMRADVRWLPLFMGPDGKVAVLDLAEGKQKGAALGTARAGAEMGTSGRSLVVYDATRSSYRIRLWDVARRRVMLDVGAPRRAPAPDTIGTGLSDAQQVLQPRERRGSLDVRGYPDATVTHDDRVLALCLPGRPLQLWDVAERRRIAAPWAPRISQHQCQNERVFFTPDGRRLALVTEEKVRVWDIRSGAEVADFRADAVQTLAFSEDGKFLATAGDDEILLWRMDVPHMPVFRYELPAEAVSDLRVDSWEGWIRYVGGTRGSWGSEVRTLDVSEVFTGGWRDDRGEALFSPDGSTLVTARIMERTGQVRFRTRNTRTATAGRSVDLPRMPCRGVRKTAMAVCDVLMAFSADGKTLAYGVSEGRRPTSAPLLHVKLWDVARRRVTDSPRLEGDFNGQGNWVVSLAFGPRDASLITSQVPENGATRIWDLRSHTPVKTLPGVNGALALRPGGRLLVTASGQAVALPGGRRPPGVRNPGRDLVLAFSRDGRHLATGDASGRTVLWSGDLRHRLGVLSAGSADRFVSALAFSRDGDVLAVGFEDGLVGLFDTATRRRIGAPLLLTSGDRVRALAFGDEGDRLHVAGEHTPPQSYDLSPERAARTVCRRVADGLSPADWRRHLPDLPYQETCRE
ncbi:hypothetical protein [Streptomyces sp. NPDC029674]|uniref:NACHT and WD repeat domain-containing protein n=1 Tax=Streptomyces sp. NPDC029674 TaxID=3365297 RepID=UPI003850CF15